MNRISPHQVTIHNRLSYTTILKAKIHTLKNAKNNIIHHRIGGMNVTLDEFVNNNLSVIRD